ncbi:MAG: hypothetical protein IRY91_07935 [Gemmatimonadaceae bacterium]|nr:hypothetical protein [Gemmatimonadaceae bacterium]
MTRFSAICWPLARRLHWGVLAAGIALPVGGGGGAPGAARGRRVQVAAPRDTVPGDTAGVRVLPRFEGTTTVASRRGPRTPLRARIQHWIVPNHRVIARFPATGFLIVQLRGGSVTTVINGVRRGRQLDEIWAVPSGVTMRLETGRDDAVLETIALLSP